MLDRSGVPSREQVLSVFPSRDKLISLKAVIECYEEIPC
ncbi:MAG: 4Fe-4S ferredoxin, partial [Erysipelothrix sp.]|nr:4Fe-4S ferredoxin [Erysipelothrix sp.]